MFAGIQIVDSPAAVCNIGSEPGGVRAPQKLPQLPTWGTGRQGRVLDEGRRSRMFRMGRQSGGQSNLVSLPECEKCQVLVEQEKTDLVVVDWSQAWWDLDLACLHSLTVTLNGESDWDYTALDTALLIYSLSLSTVQ